MNTRHTGSALLLGIAVGLAATPAMATAPQGPLPTVATLDLPQYMGTWYEIAKFPNRFQRDCVGDTRAEYRLTPEGLVGVRNQCRLANGEVRVTDGLARSVGGPRSPRLEVRFAPAWLGWLPWVWGNYWVVDLDPAYQLVAVSEPTREYLWVLARQPRVDPGRYNDLLQRLRAHGLDTQRLEPTPQPGP